jgi:hypothetical protein
MATLSYVNVFAQDIEALSGFYRDLFGFIEIASIRSPIFVGLDTGKSCLGFNAQDAYSTSTSTVWQRSTGWCR